MIQLPSWMLENPTTRMFLIQAVLMLAFSIVVSNYIYILITITLCSCLQSCRKKCEHKSIGCYCSYEGSNINILRYMDSLHLMKMMEVGTILWFLVYQETHMNHLFNLFLAPLICSNKTQVQSKPRKAKPRIYRECLLFRVPIIQNPYLRTWRKVKLEFELGFFANGKFAKFKLHFL